MSGVQFYECEYNFMSGVQFSSQNSLSLDSAFFSKLQIYNTHPVRLNLTCDWWYAIM